MPFDLAMESEISRRQFHSVATQLYADLEAMTQQRDAALELSNSREQELDEARSDLSACKDSPGGRGYWREAAFHRESERDHLSAVNFDLCMGKTEAEKEIARLKAEFEALRKDAERYRWLRSRLPGKPYRIAAIVYSEGPGSVDAAIDAAISKEAGQ